MNHISCIATAAVLAVSAAPAAAQLTLALDVNGFEYQFLDASGDPGFGGVNHTGVMQWEFSSEEPRVVDARMGDEGIFGQLDPVALGFGLSNFSATINLDSGRIEGGTLMVQLDNGDSYTADFITGGLTALSLGGFTIDGITANGDFNDDQFGDIDVTAFNSLDNLPGFALAFRFAPGPDASGTADAEVFVTVPLPPAALAGLGTLAGIMGVGAIRRRRSA